MPLAAFFSGLSKTRARMQGAEQEWNGWRDRLIMADAGAAMSEAIVAEARRRAAAPTAELFAEVIAERLRPLQGELPADGARPLVILVMGANGSGKTTTIAKLARHYLAAGKTLLLAAGDTFRAAARQQLEKWAAGLGGLEVITGSGDPAAVAYNAAAAGAARGRDIVLIDTAGRLPAQTALMAELGKISRAAQKALPNAPRENLLILDATLGQSALTQSRAFDDVAGLTGMIITKLDGSAKGGFLLPLAQTAPVPVRFVGVGEGGDDLEAFDAAAYAAALAGVR